MAFHCKSTTYVFLGFAILFGCSSRMANQYIPLYIALTGLPPDLSYPKAESIKWSIPVVARYGAKLQSIIDLIGLPFWLVKRSNNARGQKEVMEAMAAFTSDAEISAGIDSILKFMVIESYAAFEVFAGDLWTEAVNKGPIKLKKKAFTVPAEARGKILEKFPDYEFDATHHLGDIMRASECVSFQSLDKIGAAFCLIAETEDKTPRPKEALNDGIKQTVRPLKHGKMIRALCAYRNSLIHNDGVIDANFKRHTAGIAEFKDFPVDSQLTLRGELSYRLFLAGLEAFKELLSLTQKACEKTA